VSDTDSFIDEVTEEVRRDRLFGLMKRYGWIAALAVLLIVGGADHQVIDLNDQAAQRLSCAFAVEIVPGATHLFEEPGTLEQVVELAGDWFETRLAGAERAP
jgi:fermentation-respiration switch protein FrsA (DUF1100 family)